jgi:hypothetical protein
LLLEAIDDGGEVATDPNPFAADDDGVDACEAEDDPTAVGLPPELLVERALAVLRAIGM